MFQNSKSSKDLVPGDVLVLSQSPFVMFCDAVLLSGNCEKHSITKIPITDDSGSPFDVQTNKRNILSCGTEILLSRSTDTSGVRAIVFRTGFSTAKGELVRSILFPKPVALKLYSDLLKCMLIFFYFSKHSFTGTVPVIYTAVVCTELDAYPWDAVLYVLNVITFFVPPSLPAVLTSINEQAQRRLRKQGIYCLNSLHQLRGGLDVVCFDKTGTLTEDSLDILAVVPAQDRKFEMTVMNPGQISSENMVKAMATCHSLARIDEELRGYDLDIKMFKLTGWELQEPTPGENVPFEYVPPRIVFQKIFNEKKPSIAIVRIFPFESSLKRMSVITQTEGRSSFEVFLKGAPELSGVPLSERNSSSGCHGSSCVLFLSRLPNHSHCLQVLTRNHFLERSAEIAKISAQNLSKFRAGDYLERELHFLGFIVLENKLKAETIPALDTLKAANIRSVMVTGDNLLTAITVGKKCGIVEECDSVVIIKANMLSIRSRIAKETSISVVFGKQCHVALEGEAFNLLRMYNPELLEKVVLKGAIFARMLPEHKLHLIECFQNLGYHVGMCGDGANDCGALKTAHTGVSLSLAEASVAAPFTSTQQNVQCIPTLIREGRATLVSTFDSFRYMVCYSFTFLLAVLFLFWDGQRPSDGAYVTIDIILNLAPPFLCEMCSHAHGPRFDFFQSEPPQRAGVYRRSSRAEAYSVSSLRFLSFPSCSSRWRCIRSPSTTACSSPGTNLSPSTKKCLRPQRITRRNDDTHDQHDGLRHWGYDIRQRSSLQEHFFSNKLYVAVLVAEFLLVTYLTVSPPQFMVDFLNFKRAPVSSFHLKLYALTLGVNTSFNAFWVVTWYQPFENGEDPFGSTKTQAKTLPRKLASTESV
ncbi:probable cation-transporting ATPase 13A4 [Caerostris extrusa]|uniref:Probable cation-transporting ATPase 13A4 n=1 Tax=Caerostris extrusa TaxID=172846 RepID=A0AAV4Q608_CAEEX|nr:probable cation-transporting ATPase 13A4 [Caerostris extrusa]